MNKVDRMEDKKFHITRVVSRDLVRDWFQDIRSMFGARLRAYEQRIDESIDEVFDELALEGTIKWYRINQDVIGDSIIITIYGELE